MDNMLTEHYTKTRTSTAKFERNFAQTYNAVLNFTHTFAKDHNVNLMLGIL